MSEGWIKLHRSIKGWQHYQEPTVMLVWIDLLLSANAKDGWWKGERVRSGEVFTSVSTIVVSTGLDAKTVRKALVKLESSGEITIMANSKGTKIHINHFIKYQGSGIIPQPNPQPNPHQQEYNNIIIQEEKNINPPTPMRVQEKKIGFDTFGIMANVYLKPIQHRQLIETFGEDAVKTTIDELSCKLADGSTDSGNHYATLTYWLNYRKHVAPAKTSGYQKPAPATDPNQETREQREQRLKALWQQASEEDRQSYLDTYHCYPWEREQ